jgi:flagellar biosynthesis protein FliP
VQVKAILEYNLPDDNFEHILAVKSTNMYSLINETFNEIRKMIKYDETTTEEQVKILEKLRDFMIEEINERDLAFILNQ